jgi:hypothetical protein
MDTATTTFVTLRSRRESRAVVPTLPTVSDYSRLRKSPADDHLGMTATLRYLTDANRGHWLRFAAGAILPYAETVPDGGRQGSRRLRPPEPPSSSGLGHRPFKAAARVRIPLGAQSPTVGDIRGPVEQLGVLATLSRWRSRVQIPSGPLGHGGMPALGPMAGGGARGREPDPCEVR